MVLSLCSQRSHGGIVFSIVYGFPLIFNGTYDIILPPFILNGGNIGDSEMDVSVVVRNLVVKIFSKRVCGSNLKLATFTYDTNELS